MRKGVSKFRKIQAQLDNLGFLTSIQKTGISEYQLIVNGEIVKVYKKRENANKKLERMLNTKKAYESK